MTLSECKLNILELSHIKRWFLCLCIHPSICTYICHQTKKEYEILQFNDIENDNKIFLVVYLLYQNNDKEMTVSLVRKGKRNIAEDRIINLLQINGNHVCYIVNLVKFLKSFMNVKNHQEICVLCFVLFKNKTPFLD